MQHQNWFEIIYFVDFAQNLWNATFGTRPILYMKRGVLLMLKLFAALRDSQRTCYAMINIS
jgi:hypothetical protein